MVLPKADWKNQSGHAWDGLILLVGGLLVGINLQQWWIERADIHIGLAGVLLVWGVVYFTDYWQPILSIIASMILGFGSVFFIWEGEWVRPIIQAVIGLTVLFIGLSLYLFISEDPVLSTSDPEE